LFIDDFFIESLGRAHRVLNSPEKLTADAPLEIPLDRPWETDGAQFGRVLYDETRNVFRMYYHAQHGEESLVCALGSADGIHWERPSLGLVEFDGSTDNNITNCPPGSLSILWDPHEEDETRRWKRIDNRPEGTDEENRTVWRAFHSHDGYDWKPYPTGTHSQQEMLFNFGSPPETFGGLINPDARYVYYSQRGSGRRTRVLGRRDSEDFLHWSGLRTVIDQDLDDPPGTEFYSAAFDAANRTEGGLHLLMLHVYETNPAEPYAIEEPERYWGAEKGPPATSARIDGLVGTQLAASRDTVSWKRWREPFVPRGAPGAWDWGMLFVDAPVLHDGKLWFFYGGYNLTHNGRLPQLYEKPYSQKKEWGKGLAVLRPDGYVSVEADSYSPGILTTHRFRQESGGTVRVNVDASAGELRYEILEDTGAAIPSFTVSDCDPIRSDTLDRVLSWRGQPEWPGVDANRRSQFPTMGPGESYIKLRFYISPGTKLYSVTLDPPQVTQWRAPVHVKVD